MRIAYTKTGIQLEKELNFLDKLVIDFSCILNTHKIKYVIVSGYISILFGRSRTSEDIDIIVENIDFEKFDKLWNDINNSGFECINAADAKDAYGKYLSNGSPIRFSRKNRFIPNIEFKFPKVDLDLWVLSERKEVILNGNKLFISPLELQIAFKLYLGSEKDIEDARYIYRLFEDKINIELLQEFNRKLKVESLFNNYLR